MTVAVRRREEKGGRGEEEGGRREKEEGGGVKAGQDVGAQKRSVTQPPVANSLVWSA